MKEINQQRRSDNDSGNSAQPVSSQEIDEVANYLRRDDEQER